MSTINDVVCRFCETPAFAYFPQLNVFLCRTCYERQWQRVDEGEKQSRVRTVRYGTRRDADWLAAALKRLDADLDEIPSRDR